MHPIRIWTKLTHPKLRRGRNSGAKSIHGCHQNQRWVVVSTFRTCAKIFLPFKSIKRAWKVLESIFLIKKWWWSMVIDWFMFHLSKSKFINLNREKKNNFIPSHKRKQRVLCNLYFHAAVEPLLKGDFFLFPWCFAYNIIAHQHCH